MLGKGPAEAGLSNNSPPRPSPLTVCICIYSKFALLGDAWHLVCEGCLVKVQSRLQGLPASPRPCDVRTMPGKAPPEPSALQKRAFPTIVLNLPTHSQYVHVFIQNVPRCDMLGISCLKDVSSRSKQDCGAPPATPLPCEERRVQSPPETSARQRRTYPTRVLTPPPHSQYVHRQDRRWLLSTVHLRSIATGPACTVQPPNFPEGRRWLTPCPVSTSDPNTES